MMSPSIAERLATPLGDRYRIEHELGSGGMATVYLAEDVRHRRKVAIKVLHPELSAVLGSERFLKEIELTANLQHPNILPLFDSGSADGLLYYVMPYVEGETLRGRIERERQLPISDAVRISTEVADALEYAHKRGVIHRDIKPENILLHGGRPLVADFGIALALQQAGGERMTQTGMSLGTPQYMSPEQAMGDRNVDHRSDIYALGAVTYEMIAGEPPFTGPTSQAIVAKIITSDPVPLVEKRRSVPPNVDAAVMIALEKTPADRFATAGEFGGALTNRTPVTRVPHARSDSTAPKRVLLTQLIPAGVAALLIGAAIGWAAHRQPSTLAVAPMKFFLAPDSVSFRTECCGNMMLLTPDGLTLVFQGAPESLDSSTTARLVGPALYARDLGDLRVRRLPGTEGAADLFLSPDGREIGFVAKRKLYRLALRGDQPAEITTLPNGFIGGGTWMNDGRMVIAVNSVLYVVSAGGGELKPLVSADVNKFQATSPFYVPEANAILFTRTSLESEPIVEWLTLSTGTSKRVVAGATPIYVASAKALLLVRPDGTLVSYPFNVASGDTTGPPTRLAENVALQSPVYAYAEYAAARNGTVVLAARREATSGPAAAVTMWTTVAGNGSTTLKIPVDASHFDSPRISPDGTRLAIAAQDRATRRHSIYIYDFRRGTAIRLTSDQESDQLAWNSAGDSIVYRVGPKSFMSRPADGSGEAKEVLNIHDWVSVGGHSVRGPWIAFCGEKTNSFRIADIALSHRDSSGRVEPYVATNFAEFEPAISPDGQWLAYSSVETGRPEVYVSTFPIPGARIPVSRNGGHGAVWARDGRTIFYANLARDFYAVKFNPGNPPTLGDERTIFNASSVSPWTIDPDGRRLITTGVIDRGDVTGLVLLIGALSTSR